MAADRTGSGVEAAWRPKNQEEAEREVARWREAEGTWEDLLERLIKPLVWLGARTLERAVPRDRRRVAEEFIRFATRPDETGSSFLERELTSLNPRDFLRKLHSSLEHLSPLYRLLRRTRRDEEWGGNHRAHDLDGVRGQAWLEQHLAERLETEIRRMYLPPSLSKTRSGRRLRAALLSERPGEALRKLLEDVGLTQAAWAKAASLHPSAISHWIAGTRLPADNLRRLIEVLEKKSTMRRKGESGAGPRNRARLR